MNTSLRRLSSLAVLFMLAPAAMPASAGPLWRIDFQLTSGSTPPPPPIMTGDEPRAAALDTLFAPSDTSAWSAVDAPPGPTGTPDVIYALNSTDSLTLFRNNSCGNLFAAGGSTTGPQVDDRLDKDGIAPISTDTTILNFTLPKPNHPYRFAIYDPQSDNATVTQFLLNGEVAGELADNDADSLGADAPLIATANTDNTGLIRLTVQNAPSTFGTPGIAGVQIAEAPVPEPSALALLVLGVAGVLVGRRRRQ